MGEALSNQESAELARFAMKALRRAQILDEFIAERLFRVFSSVPLMSFLPDSLISYGLKDVSLDLGSGRFLLRASILVRMLSLLNLQPGSRVLQVGCDYGYLSALLSSLGMEVYVIERHGGMAQSCRKRLDEQGYQKVMVRNSELHKGWPEHGPFDNVVVLPVLAELEEELIRQLNRKNGRLVYFREEAENPRLMLVQKREAQTKQVKFELTSF